MALETDLQKMARHLVDRLEKNKELIHFDNTPAFKKVMYGEPTTILTAPLLSVMPMDKTRTIHATRKYRIEFDIHLILYHTRLAEFGEVQEEAHKRAEALELYVNADRKWNFVDTADVTKNKVIHGHVVNQDHPVVFIRENDLWATTRLVMQAMSEETF